MTVSDTSLKDTSFGWMEMIGRVVNTTEETQDYYYVVAILYNKDDQVIGVMFDIMTDEIAPGEKMSFSMSNAISYSDLTLSDVDHYEFFVYAHQYYKC